jgi:hypothetical protein
VLLTVSCCTHTTSGCATGDTVRVDKFENVCIAIRVYR